MEKIKRVIKNIFITVGFGTMVFVPLLLLDKGLNDTMKSVLTWVCASVLYGLSFVILELKSKLRFPLHIAACFAITIAARFIYSYVENGTVDVIKTTAVTIPIFAAVYIALYYFMKHIGDIKK